MPCCTIFLFTVPSREGIQLSRPWGSHAPCNSETATESVKKCLCLGMFFLHSFPPTCDFFRWLPSWETLTLTTVSSISGTFSTNLRNPVGCSTKKCQLLFWMPPLLDQWHHIRPLVAQRVNLAVLVAVLEGILSKHCVWNTRFWIETPSNRTVCSTGVKASYDSYVSASDWLCV